MYTKVYTPLLRRCFLRWTRCGTLRANFSRSCFMQHEHKRGGGDVSTHSALQRHQLEFCCLLCGWDVACSTCPFNWFNFDPKKFRRGQGKVNDLSSKAELQRAMETLGIGTQLKFTQQEVKDAFRAKALEWHPDCNSHPQAESLFKEILLAYELLLAHAR